MKPGITLYIFLSFTIAWLCWGVGWLIISRHLNLPLTPIIILGSFAPFFAAGLCSWRAGGIGAVLRFYLRGLNPRMSWPACIVAIFLLPLLSIITAALYAWKTRQGLVFQMSWAELPIAYLWLFILGGPVGEEFGWSYLADRLDEKLSPARSTLLLGSIWGFWHLPLFFLIVPGLLQHYMPFYAFLAFSISVRFLFSWAYHKTNRNILSNLLFHNALNFALSIVVIVPQSADPYHPRLWILTGLSAVCGLALHILAPAQATKAIPEIAS